MPPGDPDRLAAATLRLLGDEQLRRSLGAAARDKVVAQHDARDGLRRYALLHEGREEPVAPR